jgi:hypothetical protein
VALLLRWARAAGDELKNPYAGDPAAAVEGKRLFLKTGCYACHGHEAERAVGPDLTDDEWIYKPTDAMIFNTIAKGRRGTVMAPFGDQLHARTKSGRSSSFCARQNRQNDTSRSNIDAFLGLLCRDGGRSNCCSSGTRPPAGQRLPHCQRLPSHRSTFVLPTARVSSGRLPKLYVSLQHRPVRRSSPSLPHRTRPAGVRCRRC